MFSQETEKDFAGDCQIETDLELLIPDDYITNITERMSLYKELDSIETDEGLEEFKARLTDRFGPLPPQTKELLDIIKFRRMAKKLGLEKVILKGGHFIGYFISNQESPFYQSSIFTSVLNYVKDHPKHCRMRETREKLSITFHNVHDIAGAIEVVERIGYNTGQLEIN